MSRPCNSSCGAWKSSDISVQPAVCYSCCSVLVCPKKQWLVSVKAATAHRSVNLSLCIGHCCSWWQLSSAWQWKFCLLMQCETCMYFSPEDGNWFILHHSYFQELAWKLFVATWLLLSQLLNSWMPKLWKDENLNLHIQWVAGSQHVCLWLLFLGIPQVTLGLSPNWSR